MPFIWVEFAVRERIQGRASLHSDVGNYEAFDMKWQVAMDGLRKNPVTIIKEEDEKEDNKCQNTELTARSNLEKLVSTSL